MHSAASILRAQSGLTTGAAASWGQTKDALHAKLHAVIDATGCRLRSSKRQKSFLLDNRNMTVAAKAISERQVFKNPS